MFHGALPETVIPILLAVPATILIAESIKKLPQTIVSRTQRQKIKAFDGCINTIHFHPSDSFLVVGSLDKNQGGAKLFDVYSADEAFTTGTFGGLTPVIKIDGRIIGEGKPGLVTEKLSALYKGLIDQEVERFKNK